MSDNKNFVYVQNESGKLDTNSIVLPFLKKECETDSNIILASATDKALKVAARMWMQHVRTEGMTKQLSTRQLREFFRFPYPRMFCVDDLDNYREPELNQGDFEMLFDIFSDFS